MGLKKVDSIWVDGELVPWDQATEHVMAHSLHYGLAAFEGIRAYKQADGSTAIFRLPEHVDRLFNSCKIATLDLPFSRSQIIEACVQTLEANRLDEAYLRPFVYLGLGGLGLGSMESPVRTIVAAFEWGAYLGKEGLEKGIRCNVSSYRRSVVDSFMSKGKICGQYVTSILAKREALRLGFHEAIMLDGNGLVAEGTGENIFLIRHNTIFTPPLTSAILGGITRDTLIQLAEEAGYEVRQQSFTRDQMYTADEIFLTGTAAEVTPVREIDGREIGKGRPGPITKQLQGRYFGVVRGEDDRHREWLRPVALG